MTGSIPEQSPWDEHPECNSCEEPLGTNGGCMQCIYCYELFVESGWVDED